MVFVMNKMMFAVITATALVGCMSSSRVVEQSTVSPEERAYMVEGINQTNVDFFCKTPDERAAIFDKVQFVHEIDAFSPQNRNQPLNEIYLAQVPDGCKTLSVARGNLTSVQQVKTAREKGYKICIGPLKNTDQVAVALQLSPDYILLAKDLDKAKLRKAILAQKKPDKNFREPIDISKPGDYVLNYSSAAQRTDGTRLRVISFNILAQYWNHQPQIAPRAGAVIDAIHHFKPDLIGLQEAQKEWYEALENRIAPYQFVRQKVPADQKENPSCNILFNAERFRQIDGGILPFTDRWIRCLHWVLLEDRRTSERFIFTNTHWDLSVPKRLKNSRMMCDYLRILTARYNVPVICTGDFNSSVESAELNNLMKTMSLKDAVAVAPVTENKNIASSFWPVITTAPYKNVKHIDHVLVSPELTPLSARLILDKKLLNVSDHLPLVVDLK